MEIQLRIVLMCVGLLILFGVAIDMFKRRPVRQGSGASFVNNSNNELLRTTSSVTQSTAQEASFDVLDNGSQQTEFVRINPELDPMHEPYFDDSASDDIEYVSAARIIEPASVQITAPTQAPAADMSLFQDIFAVNIMSRTTNGFDGDTLYKALSNAHFYLGNNNIFYRHENDDGTGEQLFSLLKAVEPGYFDLELLSHQTVPGVTLLLLPGRVAKPIAALDKLVRAAKQIAFVLNGELLDHARQALTVATIDSYKAKIQNYS